ncbi:hypothetical protein P691DRAFT_60717 [Macrolepiota fuliginosa MF-IS2]|uniref:Protein SMG7 n=1 Tax=Macrolepiota fuliginosa MF-IS2 TaxID=1400762 RepID=A0A9P5XM20_9AGAR|nr:hypothetical protein P691DRAFT_60717 [Macrolepiota fuliginosa MF-IS2]
MTEQPTSIAREAKTLHNNLKELLKTKEPFDRDVDFQRKNLRRHYLNLLLVYPYAKESKDVENHLWMQTSYSFIASYKTHITILDRAISQNTRQQQQPQAQNQQAQPQAPQRSNPHGVVEYRKLIQRFRQFLAEEEKFWTLLVQRMYRTFGLTEARPVLAELGLLSESEEVAAANTSTNPEGGDSIHPGGRISNGRNHYQFPPENPDPTAVLPTSSNRGSRLAIFSKALVCLGDIARYRELYNDSNGRPRAGHDSAMPTKRKNRRGQEVIARARNYDKAQKCYDQARLLVPNEGNPWHQLAILSSYQKDIFMSVVHYYRALCVQQPYDTATDNLNVLLSRTLDTWKGRSQREREKAQKSGTAPHILVETFRERIIVLHALWRLGAERGVEKMDSIGRKLDHLVHHDFGLLVSERQLLSETISQIIVLSEGVFCKHRMIRPKTERQLPANTPILLDWRIIRHILDLHSTLLNVGKAELAVPPPSDVAVGENSLALKITATFRRTLPGLRIASKWLRANFRTLLQDPEFIALQEQKKSNGIEVSKDVPHKISGCSAITIEFWKGYTEFVRALAEAFPKTNLPALTSPLDEDVDMRGFLPLKKLMGENDEGVGQGSTQTRERPHPNAEQLMRIYDLLEDAKLLAELPSSPIKLEGNRIVFNQDMIEQTQTNTYPEISREPSHEAQLSPQLESRLPSEREPDGDALGGALLPDDDVVDEAFRARDNGLLDREFDDDDEEQIVYPRCVFMSSAHCNY